ncbi:hypothetical protein D1AOALGA4SA_8639 [Olavius algarvensis Delta 1 endosymbiont]|nr:hypothetical protein D1AOALGA4SA_8639 [Olavius algarvensis Delta 1 endosymbiont]
MRLREPIRAGIKPAVAVLGSDREAARLYCAPMNYIGMTNVECRMTNDGFASL